MIIDELFKISFSRRVAKSVEGVDLEKKLNTFFANNKKSIKLDYYKL